jgi:hypothetical protein
MYPAAKPPSGQYRFAHLSRMEREATEEKNDAR